jgi:hypothetical protein
MLLLGMRELASSRRTSVAPHPVDRAPVVMPSAYLNALQIIAKCDPGVSVLPWKSVILLPKADRASSLAPQRLKMTHCAWQPAIEGGLAPSNHNPIEARTLYRDRSSGEPCPAPEMH